MQRIVQIYKKLGETPLQALNRLRYERLEFANQNMTYLGRLDPMAEGLMLALVGDTSNKEEYLSLDKKYEFEVLWGFETDTYDTLGLLTATDIDLLALNPQVGSDATRKPISVFVKNFISDYLGRQKQAYPPYSSKKVSGPSTSFDKTQDKSLRTGKQQLWQWARAGEKVEGPEREIIIYSLEYLGERTITGAELLQDIIEKIGKVRGDFRQEQIIAEWQKNLEDHKEKEFVISKFTTHVSSGTYIRGLTQEFGKKLGCGALTYSIKRTSVGGYSL